MKKFAVTAVNIGEGSDFSPKLIAIVETQFGATNAALNYLKRECDEIEDQSGCEMLINDVHFHAADTYGMYGIQMGIQEIELNVTISAM
jgi:hypothetical protein